MIERGQEAFPIFARLLLLLQGAVSSSVCGLPCLVLFLFLQIKFLLLVSRQGKVRLAKWYETLSSKDKAKITREVTTLVLNRGAKMCNIIEYKEQKIVYKR